ncbi:MAG: efflux RND transporter periplasmic adaptor subunit [Crocinitomicaceae bacterium]|nr:efflux RND transporter periplasmic adaptor subunit [Crocinitomicaceae bacterium]
MKKLTLSSIVFLFAIIVISLSAQEHSDHQHEHTDSNQHENAVVSEVVSAEASSAKYEVLVRFTPVKPGEELSMTLFLSDVNTNRPIDSAAIQLVLPADQGHTFEVERESAGTYHIHTIMPDKKSSDLDVSISAPGGHDLLRVSGIDFSISDNGPEEEKKSFSWWKVLAGAGLLLAGIFVGRWSKKTDRKGAILMVMIFLSLPLYEITPANAHEGEEHGPKKKGENHSSVFMVAKESQFLMNVLTERIQGNGFINSRRLYGTIIPTSNGEAVITSHQAGKTVSVYVTVGQRVKQGDVLLTIDRLNDAATDIGLIAEKNRLETEHEVAKKEYDRLKSIEDIVARKQLEESKARLETARANLEIYSSKRLVELKSPIDGVVGAFTLAPGSAITADETLMTIINTGKVYLEAQAYENDIETVRHAEKFLVRCTDNNHSSEKVTLISLGQKFNSSNQSQQVLFELDNSEGTFKLGEFVNLYAFAGSAENVIAVPGSAITELEGRAVVFVKNAAEQFTIRYISPGADNGTYMVVLSGLEAGERVVVDGTYQVKLIYLNQ